MIRQGPVVLVGGYGVVGTQVARMLSGRIPGRDLVLAGRSAERALQAAAVLPDARGAVVDVGAPDPLAGLPEKPALVVSLVNDPGDNLLRSAIRSGAALLDITRWTERLQGALVQSAALAPAAPVVFASSWMAGAPGLLAVHLARGFREVDRIDISILYRLRDRAGPNSVEYADQLSAPFRILQDGRWRMVRSLTGARKVRFRSGETVKVRRFATPDLEILPRLTGARSVEVRLGYDDPTSSGLMTFLVRSGVWGALSGKRFEALRRSFLYRPGEGADHEVRVRVEGRGTDGGMSVIEAGLSDPLGQTHMTAAATVMQVERILGPGGEPQAGGVSLAESHPDPAAALGILRDLGVRLDLGA